MNTQLVNPFNAMEFDPAQGAGQLPVGLKQKVAVTAGEVKAMSTGNGGMVELILTIQEGPNAGLSGRYGINLYHNSQKTREIAERQMTALCYVTGVFNTVDLKSFFGIPFLIDVQPQAENPQYTEVKKLYYLNGNEPKRGDTQGAQQQTSQSQNNQAQNNSAGTGAGNNWNGGGNTQPNNSNTSNNNWNGGQNNQAQNNAGASNTSWNNNGGNNTGGAAPWNNR
jgi:hypothetical protein